MLKRILTVALLLSQACSDRNAGRKIATGIAQRIVVAPDAVAFLLGAEHPNDINVPEDLLLGDLYTARLDGKDAAKKVGSGVSTSPSAYAFSKGGEELAFLAGWRFREGRGELWVAKTGGDAQQLAQEATAFAWAPKEPVLAFVAPNRLGIHRMGGKDLSIPLDAVYGVAWAPDGKRLAARAAGSAGGKVWLVDVTNGTKREVAPESSDYAFAPDGTLAVLGPPPAKGGDRAVLLVSPDGQASELARATSFAFSPDGKELALLSTEKQPGEATGDLFRVPRTGGTPKPVAQRVSDWRYALDGSLVFLAKFDVRGRTGALTVAPQGGAMRELAPKAQSFLVEGKRVLWLVPVPTKGDFRIELWTTDLGSAAAPRRIDEGVYGWQLTADGKTLFYKARCAGGPRSCSLFRLPLGDKEPKLLAANVAGFDLSRDGARVLVEQPHHGASRAVDLAAIPAEGNATEGVKPFAMEADASSRFVDPAGKRIVYATLTAGKGGVYVADLP